MLWECSECGHCVERPRAPRVCATCGIASPKFVPADPVELEAPDWRSAWLHAGVDRARFGTPTARADRPR